jgi:type II secretory pathway component PulJ
VGIALSLFIVSGALTLYASQLRNSKRAIAEVRLNQELRLTSELIARQLRSAGFWSNALVGTISAADGSPPIQNPYATISTHPDNTGIIFNQNFDSNNVVDTEESLGFQLNNGVIQSQLGSGNWQDLTDPRAILVTHFSVTPMITSISSAVASTNFSPCSKTCTDINTCPQLLIRTYTISIMAQPPSDPSIVRALQQTVKIRNDQVTGICAP